MMTATTKKKNNIDPSQFSVILSDLQPYIPTTLFGMDKAMTLARLREDKHRQIFGGWGVEGGGSARPCPNFEDKRGQCSDSCAVRVYTTRIIARTER